MSEYFRAYMDRAEGGEGDGQAGEPITFVASTSNVARDKMIVEADGWVLDNYRKNPVFLWAHGMRGVPIGRTEVEVKDSKLLAHVSFDQEDEFALQVESKYRRGFLNAISVGWETLEAEEPDDDGVRAIIKKAELLDVSGCAVPIDPAALAIRQRAGLLDFGHTLIDLLEPDETRKAIPPHSTAKAPEGTAWNGPAQIAKAEGAAKLRLIHAWYNESLDKDLKQAYKLPHHLTDSGQVVWRGVAAAMARLLQAGTQIPDGDRRGVYNHLARHYRQFDKEPPEFRALGELGAFGVEEIRGLFLEGEPEMFPELFDQAVRVHLDTGEITELIGAVRDLTAEVRRSQGDPDPEEPSISADTSFDEALVQLHNTAMELPHGL